MSPAISMWAGRSYAQHFARATVAGVPLTESVPTIRFANRSFRYDEAVEVEYFFSRNPR
jgi:hypothetical protein